MIPKEIMHMFQLLDVDHGRHLGMVELKKFAELKGFDGSDDDWAEEFREVCGKYGWDRRGPDLQQFLAFVRDEDSEGFCLDEEIHDFVYRLEFTDNKHDDAARDDEFQARMGLASAGRAGRKSVPEDDEFQARMGLASAAKAGRKHVPESLMDVDIQSNNSNRRRPEASKEGSPRNRNNTRTRSAPPNKASGPPTPASWGPLQSQHVNHENDARRSPRGRPGSPSRHQTNGQSQIRARSADTRRSRHAKIEQDQEASPLSEGTPCVPQRELTGEVLQFVDWASQQHHWETLRDEFEADDGNQFIVQGSYGRRGLTLQEWTHKLKAMGFDGNAKAAFDEILREAKSEQEEKQSVRKLKLMGYDENGNALFDEVWEDSKNEQEQKQRARTALTAGRGPRYTVFIETISLFQFVRFQTRVQAYGATLSAAHSNSAASRFIKLLQQRRGSMLRAWRLDLDIRGSGKVAYVDFAHACRQLHVMSQAKNIWSSLRLKDDPRPLEFSELGIEEAANLDAFAEVLWNALGLDLEKAWIYMDINSQRWLSLEDFEAGARKLGFDGNVKLIFKGLDSSGLGRVTRRDFEYLRLVTRVAPRKLQAHPGAIADLIQWVQRKLGGVEELIGRLGLMGQNAYISVGDLAVHLAALAFDGDALQAATRAARNDGGNHVTAESLRQLFSSTLPSPATWTASNYQKVNNFPSEQRNGNSPRGAWNNGVCDLVAQNKTKPQGQRQYFSAPERKAGTGAGGENNGKPQKVLQRSRATQKPCWNPGIGSPFHKPTWDDSVFIYADVNKDLPASGRRYFSDSANRPIREEMQVRLKETQSARSLREIAPRPDGQGGSLVVNFLRFVMTRFGSLEKAFRHLDVDRSGFLRQRDFIREVQNVGFTENPNPVFLTLDKHKRGVISMREFLVLQDYRPHSNAR
jgi:Ca2+-binding EF-hand superfamily protein